MDSAMKIVTLIPARLKASRFPDKPLALIAGKPMILRVYERAVAANLGPVVVACCSDEIKTLIENVGGTAILTDPDHPTGTDRIMEALAKFSGGDTYDIIVNLQGDLPTLDPKFIRSAVKLLQDNPEYSMTTLAAPMTDPAEIEDPNIVKAVIALQHPNDMAGEALYFSRAPVPANSATYYHHIGIYIYKKAALETFVKTPPTLLETTERLEQLRALELRLRMGVQIVDTVPVGVDTKDDILKAEQVMHGQGSFVD